MTAWLSFSLSENGDMADGTDLAEAVSYIQNVPQIEVVGVNCVPMDRVLPAIRHPTGYGQADHRVSEQR